MQTPLIAGPLNPHLPSSFQWSRTDQTPDGKANLLLHVGVDFTGAVSPETQQEVLRRVLCMFIVSRLEGKALVDASESLADTYAWQSSCKAVVISLPKQGRVTISGMRNVEKAPFVFEED